MKIIFKTIKQSLEDICLIDKILMAYTEFCLFILPFILFGAYFARKYLC